jgi:hypothetical protein
MKNTFTQEAAEGGIFNSSSHEQSLRTAIAWALLSISLALPAQLHSYTIDFNYQSVEKAYKSQSHIKGIVIGRRPWENSEGLAKDAKLLEIIGPNTVVIEMESPVFRGIYNEYTFETSKLAPEEQQYVRDLYHELKNDYFIHYAEKEGAKLQGHLVGLQNQDKRIDTDIAAVQSQKEALLSSTTVNVEVIVNISDNYNFDGISAGPTSTTSTSYNAIKDTKIYDDLIRRLLFKKNGLAAEITNTKELIGALFRVRNEAKQSKLAYQKAREVELVKAKNEPAPIPSATMIQLEQLKQFYSEGLISEETYKLKQLDILEKSLAGAH